MLCTSLLTCISLSCVKRLFVLDWHCGTDNVWEIETEKCTCYAHAYWDYMSFVSNSKKIVHFTGTCSLIKIRCCWLTCKWIFSKQFVHQPLRHVFINSGCDVCCNTDVPSRTYAITRRPKFIWFYASLVFQAPCFKWSATWPIYILLHVLHFKL